MAGYLQADAFRTVVMHTPLIAIDLLVLNEHGQVLLGERLNRPAQGYWFTPGGRVRKNESLEQAFRRISHSELGVQLLMASATFRGVYEHFYRDSYFSADEHDSGTHYVVLAYTLLLADSALESCHVNSMLNIAGSTCAQLRCACISMSWTISIRAEG